MEEGREDKGGTHATVTLSLSLSLSRHDPSHDGPHTPHMGPTTTSSFTSSVPYFASSFRNRYLIHSPPSSRWRRTETASKEEAQSSIALSSPAPAPPPPRRDPPFAAHPPPPETPTLVSPFPNPRLLQTQSECVFEFVSGRWRECNEALTN